jgi:hypothetical protein
MRRGRSAVIHRGLVSWSAAPLESFGEHPAVRAEEYRRNEPADRRHAHPRHGVRFVDNVEGQPDVVRPRPAFEIAPRFPRRCAEDG